MKAKLITVLALMVVFILGIKQANAQLYGVKSYTSGGAEIYTLDPATGEATLELTTTVDLSGAGATFMGGEL